MSAPGSTSRCITRSVPPAASAAATVIVRRGSMTIMRPRSTGSAPKAACLLRRVAPWRFGVMWSRK